MPLTCAVCEGASFSQNEGGFYVCAHCGTQSQDYREEEGEQDAAAEGTFKKQRTRARPSRTDADVDVWDETLAYHEAFQRVLAAQASCLSGAFRFPGAVKEEIAALWFAYLTWSDGAGRTALGACGDLRLPHSLAFAFLALVRLREPVLPVDLVTWACNGALPYLSAHALLPRNVRLGAAAWQNIRPRTLPTADGVYRLAIELAQHLGVSLPPLNVAPILARFASRVGLPRGSDRTALAVLALAAPQLLASFPVTPSPPAPAVLMAALVAVAKACWGLDFDERVPADVEHAWLTAVTHQRAADENAPLPWSLEQLEGIDEAAYVAFCRAHILDEQRVDEGTGELAALFGAFGGKHTAGGAREAPATNPVTAEGVVGGRSKSYPVYSLRDSRGLTPHAPLAHLLGVCARMAGVERDALYRASAEMDRALLKAQAQQRQRGVSS